MNIIKEILWERTNLILKFNELNKNQKFYLTNENNEEVI